MWICEDCIRPTDTSSILPVSYGPCEECKITSACYDVTKREPRNKPSKKERSNGT